MIQPIRIYCFYEAPEEYQKAIGMFAGGDEDFIVVGTLDQESDVHLIATRLAICGASEPVTLGDTILIGTCHS